MPEMKLHDALLRSVEEILEKMFFAHPLEESSEAVEAACMLAVKVSFEGEPSGALTLLIPDGVARQIAADFLGQEKIEVNARKSAEVVCELANMICGSVLSRVKKRSTFRLASPRLLAADEWKYEPGTAEGRAVHTVHLANGSLTATIETREMPCPAEKSGF